MKLFIFIFFMGSSIYKNNIFAFTTTIESMIVNTITKYIILKYSSLKKY